MTPSGNYRFSLNVVPEALRLVNKGFYKPATLVVGYKLRRKTHTLACGMKAAFSVQNYISTT